MKNFNRDGKVNWVDEDNVFLGYDMSQSCCEYADWFVSDAQETTPIVDDDDKIKSLQELDWENWEFDPNFFYTDISCSTLDSGGVAIFRLRHRVCKYGVVRGIKYLHLFNCHNGYYCHGFKMQDRWGQDRYSGSL